MFMQTISFSVKTCAHHTCNYNQVCKNTDYGPKCECQQGYYYHENACKGNNVFYSSLIYIRTVTYLKKINKCICLKQIFTQLSLICAYQDNCFRYYLFTDDKITFVNAYR